MHLFLPDLDPFQKGNKTLWLHQRLCSWTTIYIAKLTLFGGRFLFIQFANVLVCVRRTDTDLYEYIGSRRLLG